MDRINKLPDFVLHNVLSFLDTRHMITRTPLISKRWRYLWTRVKNLNFDLRLWAKEFPYGDQFVRFKKFVEKAIVIRAKGVHPDSKEPSFSLSMFRSVNLDYINLWLENALDIPVFNVSLLLSNLQNTTELTPKVFTSPVQEIHIKFPFVPKEPIPQPRHRIELPQTLSSAPFLKALKLHRVFLPHGDSQGVLTLKCPVLETMVLENCYYPHLTWVNVSTPRLRKLTIKNNDGEVIRLFGLGSGPESILGKVVDSMGECNFNNLAPELRSFYFSPWSFHRHVIERCYSLVSVMLHSPCGSLACKEGETSVESIKRVSNLEICDWPMLLCFELQDMLIKDQDMFCNLTCLKFTQWNVLPNILILGTLLIRSPNLQKLILASTEGTLPEYLTIPEVKLDHLKLLKMTGYSESEIEFKVICDVLKNSSYLKKLEVQHENPIPRLEKMEEKNPVLKCVLLKRKSRK